MAAACSASAVDMFHSLYSALTAPPYLLVEGKTLLDHLRFDLAKRAFVLIPLEILKKGEAEARAFIQSNQPPFSDFSPSTLVKMVKVSTLVFDARPPYMAARLTNTNSLFFPFNKTIKDVVTIIEKWQEEDSRLLNQPGQINQVYLYTLESDPFRPKEKDPSEKKEG